MQITWYSFREKVFPILKIVLAMIWLANLAHTEAYFSIYILIAFFSFYVSVKKPEMGTPGRGGKQLVWILSGLFSLAVLLANAYGVQNNYEVAQTQSYGPAARGGACKAELVVSDERIDYVKADKLDSFVAFNKPSFDKFKGDINPDTRLFVDSTFVTAEDVSGTPAKQVFLFPATKYAEENFRVVCTNIVMMGYIVAHNPDISLENAQNAIRAVMNPKVVDLNLEALQFGYEHGKADLA